MIIVFGSKTRISKNKKDLDILQNACPNCKNDLVLSNVKSWFTLYFIPIFPYETLETVYHCNNCKTSYKQEIKGIASKSNQDKQIYEEEKRRRYGLTLIACMIQMAKVDGNISEDEKSEIMRVSKSFPDINYQIINQMIEANEDTITYKMLKEINQYITADGIMMLISEVARVVVADGRIEKEEERLLKEYLSICGIPEKTYFEIIMKLKSSIKQNYTISPNLEGNNSLRCSYCGGIVQVGWVRCPFCLGDLDRLCDNCGNILKPEWKVCPKCGGIK